MQRLFFIFSPYQYHFMKKHVHLLLLLLLFTPSLKSQTNVLKTMTDSVREHPKTGYNFGALPIVGFSTDVGFLYGLVFNVFNYGSGKIYPKYYQNLYMEVTRTSKGGKTFQMFYDSEYLIKGVRFTADISHLTEQALPFYGFNGSQSVYVPQSEDDRSNAYISRMFYRYDRKLTRLLINLQGPLGITGLKWVGGVQSINFKTDSVNIAALNKGLKGSDKLPHITGLYDDYIKWGLIDNGEKHGGVINFLLLGTVYDTRDNEPNPNKGIWSEAVMAIAPGEVNPEKGFTRLSITHRQYFTIIPKRLTLACRLNWQQTTSGKTPFYFLSYQLKSKPFSTTIDGLGGANTIRGILRNRLSADGMLLGNAEFRYKAWQTYWHRQNFYIALTSFYDAGMITKKRVVDLSLVPLADKQKYFNENSTGHITQSAGIGMHVVMNQNFNVAFDYGKAFSKVDGSSGFYVSIGYLF